MIVSADVEKILPHTYKVIMFEIKDDHSLFIVEGAYKLEYDGKVIGWTTPGSNDARVDIRFDSIDDATLFLLKIAS